MCWGDTLKPLSTLLLAFVIVGIELAGVATKRAIRACWVKDDVGYGFW